MSTPTPPDIKLDGLDLYAPRRALTQPTPGSEVPKAQMPSSYASEDDQPRAEESNQRPAADPDSIQTAEARINDAIEAVAGLGRSLRDHPLASVALFPSAASSRLEQRDLAERLPSVSEAPWHDRRFAETGVRRRSGLDPEIVPEPPHLARRQIAAPVLVALMVGCVAIFGGVTIISTFQHDARSQKRASDSVPAVVPKVHEAAGEPQPLPRLVVENRQAFVNEPLSLGISVDSATGYESLQLAGLAPGTRLSAGVPVSEASWQLSSRDLNGVYVYAPKGFIGIMNTAIDLLSPDKRLIENGAVRLEWVAKSPPSPPSNQIGPATRSGGTVRPLSPEAATMMQRGRDLLASGDVASARLLFRRLADTDVADGALALASTYDPRYLAQHNLIGIVGDETKAHQWYQRASELGSTEADRILARTVAK
jgi:hypothetical protein